VNKKLDHGGGESIPFKWEKGKLKGRGRRVEEVEKSWELWALPWKKLMGGGGKNEILR